MREETNQGGYILGLIAEEPQRRQGVDLDRPYRNLGSVCGDWHESRVGTILVRERVELLGAWLRGVVGEEFDN
jgi:hypothetical protein